MNRQKISALACGLLLLAALALALAGCVVAPATVPAPATPGTAAPETGETPAPTSSALTKVTLGVGYIPDVQFAPLYVAQQQGFYAEEGLEVEILYGRENDYLALAAQGEMDFVIASGEQIILARAQELPVTYVMTWYERFPVAVMAPATSGIMEPDDLIGKKVGLPGFFGANFIAWKGLVYATGLNENDVTLQEIGFTQAAAVQQGLVDAAVVYIANEPNQLRSQNIEVNLIEVSDYINLVSNGLVAGDRLIADNPDLVQRMVRGTLAGINDTIARPDEAFAVVRQVIPEITDEAAPTQRQVLASSIELWQKDKLGVSDPQAWQESVQFMSETGLLEKPVEPESLYTNQFVEAQ
jgi:NitT/TauT family transport system substrate-binding protein